MPQMSKIQKLEQLYIRLQGLELDLDAALQRERGLSQRYIKPSKGIRYSIAVVKRTIASFENALNAKAELYRRWSYTNEELKAEVEVLEKEAERLTTAVNGFMAQLTIRQGITESMLGVIGEQLVQTNKELAKVMKQLDAARLHLRRFQMKEPEYSPHITREHIMEKIYESNALGANTTSIPTALQPIVDKATGGIPAQDLSLNKGQPKDYIEEQFETDAHGYVTGEAMIAAISRRYDAEGNLIPKENSDVETVETVENDSNTSEV